MKNAKPMLTALAILLLLGTGMAGCKKKTADPFPGSGAVAGWEKASDTRTFAPKDLWQYIDGDSEQYIQAGVISTSTSDYKYNGQLEAVVDVYKMSGPDGAKVILQRGKTKDAKVIAVGEEALQYAQSVTFRKGPYIVRIVAYQAGSQTPDALVALAHGVEANL